MNAATTISSHEQAFARHGWEVPDRFNIAAEACASSYFAGRVWAVSGGQEL